MESFKNNNSNNNNDDDDDDDVDAWNSCSEFQILFVWHSISMKVSWSGLIVQPELRITALVEVLHRKEGLGE